jgi:hypothetical protein
MTRLGRDVQDEDRDAPEGEALNVCNRSGELLYDAGNQRAGAVGKLRGGHERGVAEGLVNSVVSERILSLPLIATSLRVFGLYKPLRRADERTRTADLLVMSKLFNGRRSSPRLASSL